MDTKEWGTVAARLDRLETQNRRLRAACIICILAVICLFTMGQAKGPVTVEAQRFVLRDAKGGVRAELKTLDGDLPVLALHSPNGQKETEINPLGVSVLDHAFPNNLPLAHYGDVGLYFTDGKGNIILDVGGAATKNPQLTAAREIEILNEKGSQIWHVP